MARRGDIRVTGVLTHSLPCRRVEEECEAATAGRPRRMGSSFTSAWPPSKRAAFVSLQTSAVRLKQSRIAADVEATHTPAC